MWNFSLIGLPLCMKHVVPMPLGQRHKRPLGIQGQPGWPSAHNLSALLLFRNAWWCSVPSCFWVFPQTISCNFLCGSPSLPRLPPSVPTLGHYYVITCHCTLYSADYNNSCVVLCLLTLCPTLSCLRMGFISLSPFTVPSQHLAHHQHGVDTQ